MLDQRNSGTTIAVSFGFALLAIVIARQFSRWKPIELRLVPPQFRGPAETPRPATAPPGPTPAERTSTSVVSLGDQFPIDATGVTRDRLFANASVHYTGGLR